MKMKETVEIADIVLGGLIRMVHEELKEKFENLLKLDIFPGVTILTDLPGKDKPACTIGYDMKYNEDNMTVTAIVPDEIVLNVLSIGDSLNDLGFETMLDDVEYTFLFKEYSRYLLVYQLIKAHDIKYVYDRFIGSDASKPLETILTPIFLQESLMRHYYHATENFYKDKMPDNEIGRLICKMHNKMIDALDYGVEYTEIKKNPKVVQVIWEVAGTIREIANGQASYKI